MYYYGKLGRNESYATEEPEDPVWLQQNGWVAMEGPRPGTSQAGYEFFEWRAQANGTWMEFSVPAPARPLVFHDGKLKMQNPDYTLSELPSTAMPSKRRFPLQVTLGTGGTATVDLTPYSFKLPPSIYQIHTKNAAGQIMFPKVGVVTATSAVITGERTRGTLIAQAGPYEPCTAGDTLSFWVHEN